jgi:hypothetical protein
MNFQLPNQQRQLINHPPSKVKNRQKAHVGSFKYQILFQLAITDAKSQPLLNMREKEEEMPFN